MEPPIQEISDRRLEEALGATGAEDPRPLCRERLRELRNAREDAYSEAVRDYGETVTRRIAEEGADPLACWLEFGARLAERLHRGRTVVLDGTGKAREFAPPASWQQLILHLPDDRTVRALPVVVPPEPTSAQSAALDLLVAGRVRRQES